MATAMTFWPPVYSYTLLRHSQEEEEEKMVLPVWGKGKGGHLRSDCAGKKGEEEGTQG